MKTACYVPCFNAETYIASAIEGLLRQTTKFSEILIVDDGSTDRTVEIASRYPVRIIHHEHNKGLAASRNTAWQSLDTEYIASIDADCQPEPDWHEKLLKKFTADTAGVGGRLLEQNTKDIFNKWRSVHMRQCWEIYEKSPDFLFGSNTVFSRKALIDVGGYDELFKNNYEDVDICRRLKARKHDLAYEAQAIVWHLKQDNIATLLNSYWQWRRPFYQEQGFYSTEKRLQDKMKDNIGLANRYLKEDLEHNRAELVYLDFLLALHHCLRDFQFYLEERGGYSAADVNVSLWLSLIDINFCYRFNAHDEKLRTLLKGQDIIGQNFIALVLLIGQQVMEFFKDQQISRLVLSDLLKIFFGTEEEKFVHKLGNLIIRSGCWESLLSKQNAHLNKGLLQGVYAEFLLWLENLKKGNPSANSCIIASAKRIHRLVLSKGEVRQ